MLRVERLLGTDEGFFLLALHAFVESYICDNLPAYKYAPFPTQVWDFKDWLAGKGRLTRDEAAAMVRIQKEHPTANSVRHGFARLSPDEAVAATHNFLAFCRACGIGHPVLERLRASIKVWDEKVSPIERDAELRKLRFELFQAQRDAKKLLQDAAAAREVQARAEQVDADFKAREAELAREVARERERAETKGERLDALRAELNNLNQQKKAMAEQLARFRDLDLYVEHLNRFTVYTRTRRDYERGLMRLTAEQQAALDAIQPGHDFLVRGGAGTGKTIVLLHAFSRARKLLASELGLGAPTRTVLLTYTTTLVKYDRWLAELLRAPGGDAEAGTGSAAGAGAGTVAGTGAGAAGGGGDAAGGGDGAAQEAALIQTADSFFLSRLRAIDPGWRVEYDAVDKLARRWNTTHFLSFTELAAEVEDYLFANMVTREEYVEDRVPRPGMRQPLSRAQRELVWDIRDLMATTMDEMGVFSKNYSRLKLIEHLQREADGSLQDVDFAFVDEAQDLAAADLRALKLMCTRGVIMAGDTAQAIYGLGSPYKRAGIDISGRTRILRTDFRTTCPIHDLAEKYRELCGPEIEGEPVTTHAFREGPAPELYRAATREELLRLLVEKASLFIEKLGYDPENVTILAPARSDLLAIQDRLGRRGIKSANIRDDSFSFADAGAVRLSTLHSSKGLDFPVVLLYLPALPPAPEYDEKAAEGLARNLIYVAISRAMDDLNVFVMEGAKEGVVGELTGAMDATVHMR